MFKREDFKLNIFCMFNIKITCMYLCNSPVATFNKSDFNY